MSSKRIVTIGRSDENNFRIQSESVSSKHALLLCGSDGDYLLVDLGSTNGTRVPGSSATERIKQRVVRLEDEIYFADFSCRIADILTVAP